MHNFMVHFEMVHSNELFIMLTTHERIEGKIFSVKASNLESRSTWAAPQIKSFLYMKKILTFSKKISIQLKEKNSISFSLIAIEIPISIEFLRFKIESIKIRWYKFDKKFKSPSNVHLVCSSRCSARSDVFLKS